MKIDLTNVLSEIGLKESHEERIEIEDELMEDCSLFDSAELVIDLINIDIGILATGSIKAVVEMGCAVCMKKFKTVLDISFEENVVKEFVEKGTVSKEREINSDDIFFTYNEKNELDLVEFVRELIILNLPIAAKCDINCKVKNNTEKKTIDPRLKVLEKFKTED